MRKMIALFIALCSGGMLTGCSMDTAVIPQNQAEKIALDHAQLKETNVEQMQVHRRHEDQQSVYAVDFVADDRRYSYIISAKDGDVLNYSYTSASQQSETSNGTNPIDSQTDVQQNELTRDQAKLICLQHAGLSNDDVRCMKIEQDREDNQAIYDVTFYRNLIKYEYEVSKTDGTILQSKSESDREYSLTSGMMDKSSVEKTVLNKIPGAASSHVYVHLDRDDGRYVYEGEAVYQQESYEFEIDPYTGNILEWKRETIR